MMQNLMSNPNFMQQATQLLSGSGGDMTKMREMMANNPEMQKMLKDPAFMKETLGMFRDPKNKAMVDALIAQNPSMKPMITVVNLLGRVYDMY
eukprot:CAMPEP_0202964732 /NCGR_PEP_ID=MMETSP1396-20130829/8826_1 /ASSEMBLY_ACC=CAM_ASM_000872 /TAXON_ID= /ORGANISM="Pseudokeronopsis sp., Strain Brazil" /LENGTH=92 /DNA_ID=CAMNT_0049687071 /DNA_START=1284 /DNA_END=1562 /DNA_ORIENTATION=+